MRSDLKQLAHEVFLAFWKLHILHHAGEGPLYGQWMLEELRRHGYEVSPGTLYPILKRMERLGWLRGESAGNGPKARRDYRLTPAGRRVLALARKQLAELAKEIEPGKRKARTKAR
jgi:PadR family transcriptional regulator PadR